MRYIYTCILLLLLSPYASSQNYTSYYTGNTVNITVAPQGGICLMGGATENDAAMKWFLQRASGGDVLVLRTSGSNGYNDYMYSSLDVNLNSVETIVCHNTAASYDPYVQQKIQQAEAIWFAGGDQWNYVSLWRNTPVATLINEAITSRNIVIGGTSAGMAILGGFYFSAQNGSVSSATALSNPYATAVSVESAPFINHSLLNTVITDTHYDNPDRRGRHTTFLARIKTDSGLDGKGIACDEYTAVCINSLGVAKVYGSYPSFDDNAYFIQTNCEISNNIPESCLAGVPLTWNQSNQALRVYRVKGTPAGSYTFDLSDWKTGIGGVWQNWFVINGIWQSTPSTMPDCVAMPVTLIDFTVQKDKQEALLQWRTASENNSSHFNIQRSIDGRSFETLSRISATGNSNTIQAYSYRDNKTFSGTYYYRLQITDADSSFRYSKTVAVTFDKAFIVHVYPNPARGGILHIESGEAVLQRVIVLNSLGQVVLQKNLHTSQDGIDISILQKGIYYVQVYCVTTMKNQVKMLLIE